MQFIMLCMYQQYSVMCLVTILSCVFFCQWGAWKIHFLLKVIQKRGPKHNLALGLRKSTSDPDDFVKKKQKQTFKNEHNIEENSRIILVSCSFPFPLLTTCIDRAFCIADIDTFNKKES